MKASSWDLLRALSKTTKRTQGQVVTKSLNLLAKQVSVDAAQETEPETPATTILEALKFLSKPGKFLDPRVQKHRDRSPTCAVACVWLKLRSLCLDPRDQELNMYSVAMALNINEADGVRAFLARLDGDVKKWLTYQGKKDGDLELRLKVLKACKKTIKKLKT